MDIRRESIWGKRCICSMESLYFGGKAPLKADDKVGHVEEGGERAVRILS
jgi:hypothetical protein